MGERTPIQWTDSTVNPSMGCDGCELWSDERRGCYAGVLHERWSGSKGFAPIFAEVTAFPGRTERASRWGDLVGLERPEKPWLNGLPRMIFVSDMGDSLSRAVSFEFLKHEVIDVALTPSGSKHVWQWLTKRPARMAEFSQWLGSDGIEWPSNVWAGTSVTDRATRSRVTNLLRVGGIHTTRFLSVEPQTEDLDLAAWLPRLDWVIQGGESGRDPRAFDLDWARRLRAECIEARVAYFLKQVGARVLDRGRKVKLRDTHGGDWSEWPEDLRARQMPRITATDRDPCSSPGSG